MAKWHGYTEIKVTKSFTKTLKNMMMTMKQKIRQEAVSQELILHDGRDLTQNIVYPEIFHAWKLMFSVYICVC